jgi:hypothetical protein
MFVSPDEAVTGLLDGTDLPIAGPAQAQALVDPTVSLNRMITEEP